MKNKKEPQQKKGAPLYMNTYGDMMTLLMTFFVLMFSMSTVDAEKFKAVMSSFEGSISILEGGEIVNTEKNLFDMEEYESSEQERTKEIQEVLETFKEYIEENELEHTVQVERDGLEVVLTFDDMLLFDTGKADIKPFAKPVLGVLGEKLKEYLSQGYYLSLEGHTDNLPIRTVQFPSNWELSAVRAISVAKFYINEMNLPAEKISAEGFGEQRPVAPNDTAENRSKNRRVELKLSKKYT